MQNTHTQGSMHNVYPEAYLERHTLPACKGQVLKAHLKACLPVVCCARCSHRLAGEGCNGRACNILDHHIFNSKLCIKQRAEQQAGE